MMDFVLNKALLGLSKEFGFSKFVNVKIIKFKDLKTSKETLVIVEVDNKNLRKIFESIYL